MNALRTAPIAEPSTVAPFADVEPGTPFGIVVCDRLCGPYLKTADGDALHMPTGQVGTLAPDCMVELCGFDLAVLHSYAFDGLCPEPTETVEAGSSPHPTREASILAGVVADEPSTQRTALEWSTLLGKPVRGIGGVLERNAPPGWRVVQCAGAQWRLEPVPDLSDDDVVFDEVCRLTASGPVTAPGDTWAHMLYADLPARNAGHVIKRVVLERDSGAGVSLHGAVHVEPSSAMRKRGAELRRGER